MQYEHRHRRCGVRRIGFSRTRSECTHMQLLAGELRTVSKPPTFRISLMIPRPVALKTTQKQGGTPDKGKHNCYGSSRYYTIRP